MVEQVEKILNSSTKILSKMLSNSAEGAFSQSWKVELPKKEGDDTISVKAYPKTKEEKLIYKTLSNCELADAVLIPTAKEHSAKLLVSFAAQKILASGGAFVLCHQKIKKLLMPFFKEKNIVPLFIRVSDVREQEECEAFLSLAVFISLFAVALPVTGEGKALAEALERVKQRHELVRSKPFIKLSYYDEDHYKEKYKDENATDREFIKKDLVESLEIKKMPEIKEMMLIKVENWHHFYDPTMNTRYLYGSQLYSDFKEFYEHVSFANHRNTRRANNFQAYLKRAVEDFKLVSAWSKYVISVVKGRTTLPMKRGEMLHLDASTISR